MRTRVLVLAHQCQQYNILLLRYIHCYNNFKDRIGNYIEDLIKRIEDWGVVSFLGGSSTLKTGKAAAGSFIMGEIGKDNIRRTKCYANPIEKG